MTSPSPATPTTPLLGAWHEHPAAHPGRPQLRRPPRRGPDADPQPRAAVDEPQSVRSRHHSGRALRLADRDADLPRQPAARAEHPCLPATPERPAMDAGGGSGGGHPYHRARPAGALPGGDRGGPRGAGARRRSPRGAGPLRAAAQARRARRSATADSPRRLRQRGRGSRAVDPASLPRAPQPSAGMLTAVRNGLAPRRLVTVRQFVVPPVYVPVHAEILVATRPDVAVVPLRTRLKDAVEGHLDALTGGADG